jgi:hypothetical protein
MHCTMHVNALGRQESFSDCRRGMLGFPRKSGGCYGAVYVVGLRRMCSTISSKNLSMLWITFTLNS